MVKNVLGETAYASPEDVPVKIDLVDVFRAPKHADAVVDSWIKLRVPAIWFQEGVINESAARRAGAAVITVVVDRCTHKDNLHLFAGGSHTDQGAVVRAWIPAPVLPSAFVGARKQSVAVVASKPVNAQTSVPVQPVASTGPESAGTTTDRPGQTILQCPDVSGYSDGSLFDALSERVFSSALFFDLSFSFLVLPLTVVLSHVDTVYKNAWARQRLRCIRCH
jgi:hypothetical protein